MDADEFLRKELSEGVLLDDLYEKANKEGISSDSLDAALSTLTNHDIIGYYSPPLDPRQRITVYDPSKLSSF